jgi:hypothetical protein
VRDWKGGLQAGIGEGEGEVWFLGVRIEAVVSVQKYKL